MDNYGTVDNPAWISTVSHALMWFAIAGRLYFVGYARLATNGVAISGML